MTRLANWSPSTEISHGRLTSPFPNDYQRYNEALYRLLEDPTTFDVVLARFPARKPTLLQRITTLFRRRPHD